jgi:uncharacterized protein YndB with AHSA1/START domain
MERANQPANELTFVREFNAPRELVFEVWTKSEHLMKWWGPDGFTLTTASMEAAVGVIWKFIMHGPDGTDYPNKIEFIEVIKPERLVYKHCDNNGTIGVSFEVNILFEVIENKTQLTMNMTFPSAEELQKVAKEFGAIEGAEQHLNRLKQYIYSL